MGTVRYSSTTILKARGIDGGIDDKFGSLLHI